MTENRIYSRDMTCLVVDPYEVNYFYVKALLLSLGIRVLWARDKYDAIIISISENVDIVLIDPRKDDMEDHEILKLIRRKKPDIQFVAQVESPTSIEYNHVLLSGYNEVVSKPLCLDEFRRKVWDEMIASM